MCIVESTQTEGGRWTTQRAEYCREKPGGGRRLSLYRSLSISTLHSWCTLRPPRSLMCKRELAFVPVAGTFLATCCNTTLALYISRRVAQKKPEILGYMAYLHYSSCVKYSIRDSVSSVTNKIFFFLFCSFSGAQNSTPSRCYRFFSFAENSSTSQWYRSLFILFLLYPSFHVLFFVLFCFLTKKTLFSWTFICWDVYVRILNIVWNVQKSGLETIFGCMYVCVCENGCESRCTSKADAVLSCISFSL